jgi:hypothetical protein
MHAEPLCRLLSLPLRTSNLNLAIGLASVRRRDRFPNPTCSARSCAGRPRSGIDRAVGSGFRFILSGSDERSAAEAICIGFARLWKPNDLGGTKDATVWANFDLNLFAAGVHYVNEASSRASVI